MKIVVFFKVGNLTYLANDRCKFNIINVIPTVASKISIIHKFKNQKSFFIWIFSFLPMVLIHGDKVLFEVSLLKIVVVVDFCHLPIATHY